MDVNRFIELLEAYLHNMADADDQQELFLMIASGKYDDQVRLRIDRSFEINEFGTEMDSKRGREILELILAPGKNTENKLRVATDTEAPPVVPLWKRLLRFGAAAVFLFMVFGLWYVFTRNKSDTPPAAQRPTITDLQPGDDRARLTLANGDVIILDSAEGNITKQGDVTVINFDGRLSYERGKENGKAKSGSEVAYNTISTPRGGQYQLVLSDGSKVWLNAASSLKFPVSFTGNERRVELTGEGFFDIVHNAKKPFLVAINGAEVHDLGTAFNINSYTDEGEIKVTLVEGAAEVRSKNSKGKIKPGQQAQIHDSQFTIHDVDVTPFISWKDNKFYFDGADIHTVARQLSRWYDVDVEVRGNIPDHFTGIISRKVPSSQVFVMLEKTGAVKFKIENARIIITRF